MSTIHEQLMAEQAERAQKIGAQRYYVSLDHERDGLIQFEDTGGPARGSYYVRERGAGAPIATAGGQLDSLCVAGPFATTEEAEEAMRQFPDGA